ncbi:MAG: hypothetical protein ACKOAU_05730, partial [Pirellula sp.]
MLAVGLDNGYLVLLQERQGSYQVVERIRFSTTVTAISFWEDETKIALGENSGAVHVLNLPDQWPTRSRLRFSQFFLDESAKLLAPSVADSPEDLWGFVANSSPFDARYNVPLEMDRVYLEFTKPLKNILFSDNYVREWFDDQGNSKPSWSEMPKNVIFKDDGIELQFENRYGGYSGTVDLESQGRLKTWVCHSKRVSSIVCNNLDNQVFSFSEDGYIKFIQADASSTMKIGGDDVLEFLPSTDSRVYVSALGSRPKVLTLGKNIERVQASQDALGESIFCLGLVPHRDDLFLFASKNESSVTQDGTRNYFLCDLRSRRTLKTVKAPNDLNPLAVVGEISQDCFAVIAQEDPRPSLELGSEKLPSQARMSYLASWDLGSNTVRWRTPATEEVFRSPKTSQNGNYLSFVMERKVLLLDCNTGTQRNLGDFSGIHIASTCFSADGKQLLVAIADNLMLCFETQTGKQRWVLRTPGSP